MLIYFNLFYFFYVFRALVCEADEEGTKHLLLCRVILGKPEQIVSGSKQSYPSSSQFDSGVDDLENPRKYVIWSSTMNSYILPSHVVSFKSPRLRGNIQTLYTSFVESDSDYYVISGLVRGGGGLGRARSPCVSFSVLIYLLSKSLDPPRMHVVLRTYDDFRVWNFPI